MSKCRHVVVEPFNRKPGWGDISVRCADCHAIMVASARGHAFAKRWCPSKRIPLDRKYWKEFVNPYPDPMAYEARMRGYENIYVVRR